MMTDLLPPASTRTERALAATTAPDRLDITALRTLWDPQTCPESHLPWLAWALSVDVWDDSWPLQRRRDVLAGSIAWHRKKGTPWAVEQMLDASGYPGSQLIEHHEIQQAWRDADGEYLDGSDTLDGIGNLSTPGIAWRAITHSWAEYVVRLNIGDKPWDRASQREAVAICNAYAPARSQLAALLVSVLASFDSTIRIHSMGVKSTTRMAGCQRFVASSFDTLDGCTRLGGGYAPALLDGSGTLDGFGPLDGQRPTGEPFSRGQLAIKLCGTVTPAGFAAGGDIAEPPETLDDSRTLDGRYTLAGDTLDGFGALDGGTLYYPTLADPDDTLDGTSNLGEIPGPAAIHYTGVLRTWRGSTVTQEAI